MNFLRENFDKLIIVGLILVFAALAFIKDSQFWQGVLTGSTSALYLLIRPNKPTTPPA